MEIVNAVRDWYESRTWIEQRAIDAVAFIAVPVILLSLLV